MVKLHCLGSARSQPPGLFPFCEIHNPSLLTPDLSHKIVSNGRGRGSRLSSHHKSRAKAHGRRVVKYVLSVLINWWVNQEVWVPRESIIIYWTLLCSGNWGYSSEQNNSLLPRSLNSSKEASGKQVHLHMTTKAQAMKAKIDKWDYVQLKKLLDSEGPQQSTKSTQRTGETICRPFIWWGVNIQNT